MNDNNTRHNRYIKKVIKRKGKAGRPAEHYLKMMLVKDGSEAEKKEGEGGGGWRMEEQKKKKKKEKKIDHKEEDIGYSTCYRYRTV